MNKELIADLWIRHFDLVIMYKYMSIFTKLILLGLLGILLLYQVSKMVKKYGKKFKRLRDIADGNFDNEIYESRTGLFSRLHKYSIAKEIIQLLLVYLVVYIATLVYTICIY